jgi:alcohol dehydrogenase class IV
MSFLGIRYSFHDLFKRAAYFVAPKEIVIEVNGVLKVNNYLRNLGVAKGSKILILIDPVLRNLDNIKMMEKVLSEDGFQIEWITEIEYEPSINIGERLVELGRKAKPSAVIGIGGGSTLDLAKVIAVGVDNVEMSIRDFIGVEKVSKRVTPLILMPSTAGTGSEVSRYVILRDETRKIAIASRHVVADVALVDPTLTYTMPPRVTASSGLDALSHAVEAMISTLSTPLTDTYSLLSVKLIFDYLLRAYLNGKDEEARYYMSMAATIAGIPLTSAGMVYGHSIAQTFGPTYKIPHGIACGMTLPYVMDFYLPVLIDKYNAIADMLGISREMNIYSRAVEVVKHVWNLVKDLEVPLTLKEVGVSAAELEVLAERTLKEWPRANSPIEMSKERMLKIYKNMYEGKLSRVKVE